MIIRFCRNLVGIPGLISGTMTAVQNKGHQGREKAYSFSLFYSEWVSYYILMTLLTLTFISTI